MEQIHRRTSRSADPAPPEEPPMPPPAVAAQGLDSILDDISDILESDALTFVQSYSQTGGQ